jgi:WhiB family transcriptional regulator, redox-sensing transcriptional regulator
MAMRAQQDWQRWARCRGPEAVLFFPPTASESSHQRAAREFRAKAICARCDVRRECLDEALRIREPHGIWGGHTEAERRAMLARQPAV